MKNTDNGVSYKKVAKTPNKTICPERPHGPQAVCFIVWPTQIDGFFQAKTYCQLLTLLPVFVDI